MTNIDLIQAFIDGSQKGQSSNLRINGDKLINYNTTLAQRTDDDTIIVNLTEYSSSTSRIQNSLIDELNFDFGFNIEIITDVPIGEYDLAQYFGA